jgi:hypothetical protein
MEEWGTRTHLVLRTCQLKLLLEASQAGCTRAVNSSAKHPLPATLLRAVTHRRRCCCGRGNS